MSLRNLAAACGFVLAVASAAAAGEVAAVLAKVPAGSEEERKDLDEALSGLDERGCRELVGMLTGYGEGKDHKPRLALHALAYHVARPGADAERRSFCRALVAELDGDRARPEEKGYLIRLLRLAGGDGEAETLGRFLGNDDLCEYAAQALVSIDAEGRAAPGSTGGGGPVKQFRKALAGAKGRNRVTIIQSVGVVRDKGSVRELEAAAKDGDREVRLAGLRALGNIGDPRSEKTVVGALGSGSGFEKARAAEAVFLFIRRLDEAGKDQDAARIARKIWQETKDEENCHIRCAALQAVAAAVGSSAMDELRAAMKSDDIHIRSVATETALMLPGEDITRQWVEQLKAAETPGEKVGTLAILSRRGDRAALDAVLGAMKDPDEAVQVAAIDAVAALGGAEAVKPLVASLGSDREGERKAAQTALGRLRGADATRAAADALKDASAGVRCMILEVLAARGAVDHLDAVLACAGDPQEPVRAAAWKAAGALADASLLGRLVEMLGKAEGSKVLREAEKAIANVCSRAPDRAACAGPIIRAMRGAGVPARCVLLGVLGTIGGREALEAVSAAWDDRDEKVKEAAVRTLGEWPTCDAAAKLLSIAKSSTNVTHRVLALRGYVRVVGLPSGRSADETLALYRDAMQVAKRPEERKLVLAGLGGVGSLDALRMAEKEFRNPELSDEACISAVKIARLIGSNHRDEAMKALSDIAGLSKSDFVKQQAREAVQHLERFDDYVTTWQLSGPYTNADAGGKPLFDAEFAPERPDGKPGWISWTGEGDKPYFVDFLRIKSVSGSDRAAYLRAQLYSPREQAARLELGSDDQVKVWVDGKLVHANPSMRGYKDGEDKPEVRLKEGWNVLLVKVTQGGGDWSAGLRVRAADGSKLEGLRVKAE